MKRILLFILLFWGTIIVFSQTIIAKQSFETSGDTWAPISFSTPPCNFFGDVWDYSNNLDGLTPSEGNRFWGIKDLDGSCGGNGFETITFPDVNISAYENVVFSFDYFAFSFDNNDDLKYELFFDNISQGEVVVIDGVNNNTDNTNGWVTESVDIPNTVTNVRLILSARNNNFTDIGGFDNVLLLSSPITNGGCSNAIPLTVGENNTENIVNGTNIGATSSGEQPEPSCGNYAGRDVWFTAQVPANGILTIETLNSIIDPSIAVYTGTCGSLTEIGCNDDVDYDNNNLESKLEITSTPNTTLYIRVYAYNNSSSGEFNIVAYSTPTTQNDNCFTAQSLTVGSSNTENIVTSTNENASSSDTSLNPNCDSYQGGDVWFTAQVPASGFLNVETLNVGGIDDTGLAIYTGSCGNLTQIACDADSGSGFFSLISLSGLPNTTVYIRVWEYQNNNFGEFGIVAYSPKCPASTTWNGSSWSNGAPNEYTSAIINADYNTNNGNFESCNCTINNGARLIIRANEHVTINNNLTVNGILNVRNQGSLVMTNDNGTVSGSGTTRIRKTTTPYNKYDYTYWSSPTNNETIGGAFPNADPKYMYRYNYQSGWININGGTTMNPATGYIVEGDTSGTFPRTEAIVFNGSVNNGIITTPVNTTGTEGFDWNLVGNPYPSAIDANLLLSNNPNVNGTIYLWTHNTEISENNAGTEKYNYSSNDYAGFNAGTGGIAAISGGPVPNGYLASGQGFFLQANTSGILTFNNAMRVTNNNQFFKSSNKKPAAKKDRIWLNLTNDKGAFSQILIGYILKATNGVDRNFDGKRFDANSYVSFYSLIDNEKYAIQGKQPINNEDIVKLGFSSKINSGDKLKISIDNIEGKLEEYNIYLKDNLTNLMHDLKLSNYEFVMNQKGIFNDRFELHFTKSAVLSTEEEVLTNSDLLITNIDNTLTVKTTNGMTISNFKAYDVLGKLLISKNANKDRIYTDISSIKTGTILLINTTLDNNQKITKKILIQ